MEMKHVKTTIGAFLEAEKKMEAIQNQVAPVTPRTPPPLTVVGRTKILNIATMLAGFYDPISTPTLHV